MSEAVAAPAAQSAVPAQSAPVDAPAPEAAPPWTTAKHKIKVDGEEIELGWDDLVKEAQKGRGADKRYREAAQLKQGIAALVDEFKTGKLDKLVELAGADTFRQAAEKYLISYLEEQQLPEGERKARALEKQYKDLESRYSREKEQASQAERQRLEQQAIQEIDLEIADAVKATGRKPTPRLIARIAEHMLATLDAKDARLSAKDAYSRTVQDFREDIAEYLRDMPAAEARKMLPKEFLDALRKDDVAMIASQAPRVAPKRPGDAPRRANGKERMASDSYFQKLDKRFGG